MEKFEVKLELTKDEFIELFGFGIGFAENSSELVTSSLQSLAIKIKSSCKEISTEEIDCYLDNLVKEYTKSVKENPEAQKDIQTGFKKILKE